MYICIYVYMYICIYVYMQGDGYIGSYMVLALGFRVVRNMSLRGKHWEYISWRSYAKKGAYHDLPDDNFSAMYFEQLPYRGNYI